MSGFWPDLSCRRRQPEWMDAPDADPALLDDSLRFIRRVNRALRYTRTTLLHLEQFSHRWTSGQTIRILDVATGSGDVPLAIAHWASRRGLGVRVTGVDMHAKTCRAALKATIDEPAIEIVRGDALRLPFDSGSFDYAVAGLFLHHLSDSEATTALREMDRVVRRGIIVADLIRGRRAYAWIVLLTRLSNPMVRHDARVSVEQAFSAKEARELPLAAGLGYLRYHAHFGHRFVLSGEKDHAWAAYGSTMEQS